MGKLDYEEKKQARIDGYKAKSAAAEKASNDAYNKSKRATEGIPFGQPILVGHHSEKRHRAAIEKASSNMDKSVSLSKKSDYYADKAAAAENNTAISSDDPKAIEKLKNKIKELEDFHEQMKAVNKICRKKGLSKEDKKEMLKSELNLKDDLIDILLNPERHQKPGFQSYQISLNKQSINRYKKRLEEEEKKLNLKEETFYYNDTKVVINVDDNRVEIYFSDKPADDFRKKLKMKGFKWSFKKMAWQKKIHDHYIRQAKELAQEFENL